MELDEVSLNKMPNYAFRSLTHTPRLGVLVSTHAVGYRIHVLKFLFSSIILLMILLSSVLYITFFVTFPSDVWPWLMTVQYINI